MNKATLILPILFISSAVFSQKKNPTIQIKAHQRSFISGVAPTATIEIGQKEKNQQNITNNPEYFIYLIANKIPHLKIDRIWINQQLYISSLNKLSNHPVVLQNGKQSDTLVKYTQDDIWQIKINGKDTTRVKLTKDIAALIKSNELVLLVNDLSGNLYTRTVKNIHNLEAERGQ